MTERTAPEVDERAPSDGASRPTFGPLRSCVGFVGERVVGALVRLFGRSVRAADVPWLTGPIGGPYIGDTPYEEWAARTGATVERRATSGGLLPRFDALRSDVFEPSDVDLRIRHFYEATAEYQFDVWARTHAPAAVALWLLVTTISRRVDQLNFPLDLLETASGMDSEIILLRDADGVVRTTGWYRRIRATGRSVYTGFYSTASSPITGRPLVKVVFPMPGGSATVLLEPRAAAGGALELSSAGSAFGDAGFYRLQCIDERRLRVWWIRSLREHFRLHVDADGVLRCDHRVRFLGLPVLHLHYRLRQVGAGAR